MATSPSRDMRRQTRRSSRGVQFGPPPVETRSPQPVIDDASGGPARPNEAAILERTLLYLREHFRTASLEDVARHAGLSTFHFHRKFREWTGRTLKDVITELQLEHARSLLREGQMALPHIATECGFAHQSHLTARFRQKLGTTPGRWRRAECRAA